MIPASRGGKRRRCCRSLAISWYIWPFTGALAAVGPWIMAVARGGHGGHRGGLRAAGVAACAPGTLTTLDPAHCCDALAARPDRWPWPNRLTGGLLAATLWTCRGERVFRGGLVVYATDLKASLAGVAGHCSPSTDPVHPDVARGPRATGARLRLPGQLGTGHHRGRRARLQDGIAPGTVYVAPSTARPCNSARARWTSPATGPRIRAGTVPPPCEPARRRPSDSGTRLIALRMARVPG